MELDENLILRSAKRVSKDHPREVLTPDHALTNCQIARLA